MYFMFWFQRGWQQMLFPLIAVVMMAGFLLIHFSPEVASAQTVPLEGQSGIIEKSLPQSPLHLRLPQRPKLPKLPTVGPNTIDRA